MVWVFLIITLYLNVDQRKNAKKNDQPEKPSMKISKKKKEEEEEEEEDEETH